MIKITAILKQFVLHDKCTYKKKKSRIKKTKNKPKIFMLKKKITKMFLIITFLYFKTFTTLRI